MKKVNANTRRDFIKTAAVAGAGITIVPRHVLGGVGYVSPSDRLNIATIGAAGKGHSDTLNACGYDNGKTVENIVALCDVNDKIGAKTFDLFPKAKKYRDYRVMLDEMNDQIDAVIISTPDHMHGIQGMAAITRGKHVYIQKPLAHDVYEARMLTEAARKHKVVTQMGNQGSSSDEIRYITEVIEAGTIGDVREVHCWTNRPVWEQGMYMPKTKKTVPAHLDWDLWLGTAPYRDFNDGYQPFNWRGWWDFGTGALGDMACHIMDPVVRALKLKYPSAVQAFAPLKKVNWARVDSHDSPPVGSMVHYDFPSRAGMPPVKLTWYDGGLMPPRPDELMDDEPMGGWDGGVIFVGSKGKLMCDCYAQNPRLLPLQRNKGFKAPDQTIQRVKEPNHQRNWIESIKGNAECSSGFDYAGPFSEIVLMGNLAIRSLYVTEEREDRGNKYQAYIGEGKKLKWDGERMKITNFKQANQFVKRDYRKGWKMD